MGVDITLIWQHPFAGLFGLELAEAALELMRRFEPGMVVEPLLAPRPWEWSAEPGLTMDLRRHWEWEDQQEDFADPAENPSVLVPDLDMTECLVFLNGTGHHPPRLHFRLYPNGIAEVYSLCNWGQIAYWPSPRANRPNYEPLDPALLPVWQAHQVDPHRNPARHENNPVQCWQEWLRGQRLIFRALARHMGSPELLITNNQELQGYFPDQMDSFEGLLTEVQAMYGPPARNAAEAYWGRLHEPPAANATKEGVRQQGYHRRHYMLERL